MKLFRNLSPRTHIDLRAKIGASRRGRIP
jgi:transcriptional regulator with XRE-family HTH domain